MLKVSTEAPNKVTIEGNGNLFISSSTSECFEAFLHHLSLCESPVIVLHKEIISYLFHKEESTHISIGLRR